MCAISLITRCATDPTERMKNKQFILSGRYELIRPLGQGSFGNVYLARHISMEIDKAVKIIPKNLVSSTSELFEAKLLRAIDHPCIPQIFDIEEDLNNFYLIEEYVQGESLNSLMLHQQFISQELYFKICEQLCNIMNYLHTFKPSPIIYGDLKPEHIIVCGNQIKLIDFSIATYVSNLGNKFNHFGNVTFSAPETFLNQKITLSADIYSIGQIMKYMSDYLNVSPSPNLRHIIQKSTAHNPNDRYKTVTDLECAILKEINNDGHAHFGNSIAVVGGHTGCGATHIAVSLVSTLNSIGYSSVYYEKNKSSSLQHAAEYSNEFIESNGYYYSHSFCGIPDYGPGIHCPMPKDSIIIIDFGTNFEIDDLLNVDQVILVCTSSFWHRKNVIDKNNFLNNSGIKHLTLCNLCQHHLGVPLAKQLNTKLYCYPFDPNPIKPSKFKNRFFKKLLTVEREEFAFFSRIKHILKQT